MNSQAEAVTTNDSRVLKPIAWVGRLLDVLSGEYLLTQSRYPNGGTIVFVRALIVTVVVFALALVAINAIDPERSGQFSILELRLQIRDHGNWLGPIFAAAYVALYARFASQWTYLSGVYNQIKAAEARGEESESVLAEWKAGFIEDADELHLIRKAMFSSIANNWLNVASFKDQVRAAFDEASPGGSARCQLLAAEVARVVERESRRYAAASPVIFGVGVTSHRDAPWWAGRCKDGERIEADGCAAASTARGAV